MKTATVVLLFAACAFAAPIVPTDWLQWGSATADGALTFDIALHLRNGELLSKLVMDVSDPKSSAYGDFLTGKDLEELTGATDEAIAAVSAWVATHGGSVSVTALRGMIRTTMTVSQIEKMLQISLSEFTHTRTASRIVRTLDAPVIPEELKQHIDVVYGLTSFPIIRDLKFHNAPEVDSVTPSLLRTLYGVNEAYTGSSKSQQALAEFQSQSYSPTDLKKFLADFSLPDQVMVNETGNHDTGHGIEANLDVQYIMAMGQLIPTDFYLHQGMQFDLIGWITSVEVSPTLQNVRVWSVSYGEALEAVTVEYAQRLDQEFQKVAVLGTSIIFASGDSGVYSRTGGFTKFHPSFPACLPTVTAVGATQLDNGEEKQGVSWSGGGFSYSNYFTRPTYQDSAVNGYLNSGVALPPSDMWDSKGRAFPDVSAQGVNYQIVERGVKTGVSGTSAACPCFAGIVALINDHRLAAGKKALGFLNPFLYQNADALNDITEGTNSNGHQYGFTATKGFDPVTGLGTPNYPKLKAAAMALP